MKSISFFVILLLFLYQEVESRSVVDGKKYTCIVNYLRVKGVIGSEFGSINHRFDERCKGVVEATREIELKSLQDQIEFDENDESVKVCLLEELKKNGFENHALMKFVYENAPQFEEQQVDEYLKVLELKINRDIYKSNILCNAEKSFRKLFFEGDDAENEDEKLTAREDYCIRRFIVENDLTKLKGVTLEIDTSHPIDCSKNIHKALLKMETNFLNDFIDMDTDLNEEGEEKSQTDLSQRNCFLQVTHEGDFLRRTLVFDYVKEMNLTPRQKNIFKNVYVKLLNEFADKTSLCI
jgi:hypothetical protein